MTVTARWPASGSKRGAEPVLRALLAGLVLATPLDAQGIEAVDYDTVLADAQRLVTFEILPPRPEPGYPLDHGIAFAGGRIGSAFAGQSLSDVDGFDRLGGPPSVPLSLITGPSGQGLSLATHRGFGSLAIYPLGSAGFPALNARGEGSVAILFDEDVCQVGLRVHSDYPDTLGANAAPRGAVTLAAFGRAGETLGQISLGLASGITSHGLRSVDSLSAIAGLTVENSDPGGIALDDLAFGPCAQALG
ncbi:hypothetical protein [Nioella aestuarii]|uniref:hypothetical protein n=1 Tax=Nioella aestuarii TaxID=1662864 RepID=UPI003D7FEDD2